LAFAFILYDFENPQISKVFNDPDYWLNLNAIIETQKGFAHDIEMVKSVKSKTLDINKIKDWMKDYSLFRGINSEDRLNIAKAFLKYAHKIDINTEFDINYRFQELHSILYNVKNRK